MTSFLDQLDLVSEVLKNLGKLQQTLGYVGKGVWGPGWVDVTSRVFWEITCKSSSVLVRSGLHKGDFGTPGDKKAMFWVILGNVGVVLGGGWGWHEELT